MNVLQFLEKYSIYELIIIVAAVLITQLLKWPVKIAAKKYEEKTGKDKSRITCWLTLVPFVLCFIGAFILNIGKVDWATGQADWSVIIGSTAVLGSGAVAAFEIIKKFVEGFAPAKKVKPIEAEGETNTDTLITPEAIIANEKLVKPSRGKKQNSINKEEQAKWK